MKNNSVTIGIPSYNSGRYIKNCLESILDQTYKNLEIIVVDNGSTDNTEEIVYSFKDPRVRFHKNSENIYCYGSTNVIINFAKTQFVAVYHSDDVYKPTIVEEQVNFLSTYKNVMAVFTEAECINSKGKIIGELKLPNVLRDTNILDFKTTFNRFMKYEDFLICPSGMFKKKVFYEIGYFKEENFFSITKNEFWLELLKKYGMNKDMIFTANDLEMWLRILQRFQIGIIHKKLMCYRRHPEQGSRAYSTSQENFFIVMDYYERYAREKDLISEYYIKHYKAKKIRWIFSKGQHALIEHKYHQAKKEFMQFIKNFYLLFPCLKLRDIKRFLWAFEIILLARIPAILNNFLRFYLIYKKRQQKRNKL